MKHSSTYPFRRWYRRPLTPRESAVIGLLERRRRRTGRVHVVLTVSAAEHAAISRLLLHYALFLNNRCTLSYTLLVTAAGPTPHFTLQTPHCAVHGATRRATPHSPLLTPHCTKSRAHPARAGPNSSLRAAQPTPNCGHCPPPPSYLYTINYQLKTTQRKRREAGISPAGCARPLC